MGIWLTKRWAFREKEEQKIVIMNMNERRQKITKAALNINLMSHFLTLPIKQASNGTRHIRAHTSATSVENRPGLVTAETPVHDTRQRETNAAACRWPSFLLRRQVPWQLGPGIYRLGE